MWVLSLGQKDPLEEKNTQLSIRKTDNLTKKWAEEPIDIFPKKAYKWPMKRELHHESSEKCKSKLQ